MLDREHQATAKREDAVPFCEQPCQIPGTGQRERTIAARAESLPDYELLEMLLFAANPQGDVKPTAKALLTDFGGFKRGWVAPRMAAPSHRAQDRRC